MMSIRQALTQIGLTAESLDDIVIDAASDMASNANNGGMKEQLAFLQQAGYSDARIWATILTDQLEPGMSVDVTEPKHKDSPHSCSFSGSVVEILDEYIRVRDMDDHYWDISFNEIENFDPASRQGGQ